MPNRILKDIRYFESDKPNISGQSLPSYFGKILIPTKDTNYIGQRIARKLNELKFSYGEYDHIYINFTTVLKENEIKISDRKIENTIKAIDYGLDQIKFNNLNELEKNKFIISATIEILKKISNSENFLLVEEMEKQLNQFGTELKINFKENQINLIPKKSFRAYLYNGRYKIPIELSLKDFIPFNF